MKGVRLLRVLGHPNPGGLTPQQVFFDLEILREDRRRERVHNANMIRTMTLEGVPSEDIQKFLDQTP